MTTNMSAFAGLVTTGLLLALAVAVGEHHYFKYNTWLLGTRDVTPALSFGLGSTGKGTLFSAEVLVGAVAQ